MLDGIDTRTHRIATKRAKLRVMEPKRGAFSGGRCASANGHQ